MKNIVVLGCGLVGRVMAEDLSQNHNVTSVDISQDNLDKINSKAINKICKDVSVSNKPSSFSCCVFVIFDCHNTVTFSMWFGK